MTVTRQDFESAVAAYWGAEQLQIDQPAAETSAGVGSAGDSWGGRNFGPIAALIAKFFLDAGYPSESIMISETQGLELPGHYRPQKRWDIVVSYEETLVAAFELKTLSGPLLGNDCSDRVEEALGSAVDLCRATLADLYPGERPWLGYFFLMQDEAGSRRPVRMAGGDLSVEEIWHGTSYRDRVGIFCERLMAGQLYDGVCYVTSSASGSELKEPVSSLDWRHFSAAVTARLTYLKELGIPEPGGLRGLGTRLNDPYGFGPSVG